MVEQHFRVAVDVQRLFILALFDKVSVAAAVSGGGRGVQERNLMLQAPVQQLFRVLVVVIHHVFAIPLGGGRAGAFMENRFHITEVFISEQ